MITARYLDSRYTCNIDTYTFLQSTLLHYPHTILANQATCERLRISLLRILCRSEFRASARSCILENLHLANNSLRILTKSHMAPSRTVGHMWKISLCLVNTELEPLFYGHWHYCAIEGFC